MKILMPLKWNTEPSIDWGVGDKTSSHLATNKLCDSGEINVYI